MLEQTAMGAAQSVAPQVAQAAIQE
jgi:hypothetical protein